MDTATITSIINDSAKRHDFVLLFDVTDGNPNGDPDAGNLPRVDPETMQGLVTDVCLKRKVRDFVNQAKGTDAGFQIYVEHKGVLNRQHGRAYTARDKKPTKSPDRETQDLVRTWMCENFYDIRMFGAVMTTQVNCGQVRGPLQLTFARSIDPVIPLDVSITRVAVTREEDAVKQNTPDDEGGGKETEMGRKALLPYGLYVGHGFFNPHFAAQTGVSAADLELFWQALVNMFEQDRSAARGMMACRGLYVFSHDNPLGNAPAHKLFERVEVERRAGVEAPRAFGDYAVTVNDAELPTGVILTRVLE
jgi:CRISPR-associated protein Csd2